MCELVNLVPHDVNVFDENGREVLCVPASEPPARCVEHAAPAGELEVGDVRVPVRRVRLGEVMGLPEPRDGTVYIVSVHVLAACPDRHDLVIPDDLVRDAAGNIVGCRSFSAGDARPDGCVGTPSPAR